MSVYSTHACTLPYANVQPFFRYPFPSNTLKSKSQKGTLQPYRGVVDVNPCVSASIPHPSSANHLPSTIFGLYCTPSYNRMKIRFAYPCFCF